MKVLHVIPAIAARYGGPSTAVTGLCRALRDAGVDVLIATTNADGDGQLPLPLGRRAEHDGLPVIAFRRWAAESLKFAPGLSAWVRAHVGGFDLVHIHGVLSHACIAASRAAASANVPYVIAPLGTLDPESLAAKPARKAIALRYWGEQAILGAAAVLCTAPGEFAAIGRRFPGARPVLAPLGVPDDAFLARPAAGAPLIACVTRLAPRKGLERLLDAFNAAATGPSLAAWRLVIAGDGDARYVASLTERASRLAAAPRIRFAGWVDAGARRALLEQASLFALPSEHENFGLAVLEALAAGVPAVVTDAVQLSHWIAPDDAGWVTTAGGSAFEMALRAAMTNEGERGRRAQAARNLAGRFRWPAIASETIERYRQCCAAPLASMAASAPAR